MGLLRRRNDDFLTARAPAVGCLDHHTAADRLSIGILGTLTKNDRTEPVIDRPEDIVHPFGEILIRVFEILQRVLHLLNDLIDFAKRGSSPGSHILFLGILALLGVISDLLRFLVDIFRFLQNFL